MLIHGKVELTTKEYTILAKMPFDHSARGFSVNERITLSGSPFIFTTFVKRMTLVTHNDGIYLILFDLQDNSLATVTKIEKFGSVLAGTSKLDLLQHAIDAQLLALEAGESAEIAFPDYANGLVIFNYIGLEDNKICVFGVFSGSITEEETTNTFETILRITVALDDMSVDAIELLDFATILPNYGFGDRCLLVSVSGDSMFVSRDGELIEIIEGAVVNRYPVNTVNLNIIDNFESGFFFSRDYVYQIANGRLEVVSENYEGREINSKKVGVYLQ